MTVLLASVFFALVAWSVVTDLHKMIIPNWLSGAVFVLFIPAAFVAGLSWPEVGGHVLAMVIALAVCFLLFAVNVFGGGDAKLIPGVMLWVGAAGGLEFLTAMALVGGVLGLILLLARRVVPAGDVMILQKTSGVPYAVAIAAGAIYAAPQSALLTDCVQPIVRILAH